MARTKRELGSGADAIIRACLARGESARQIGERLAAAGYAGASPRTIARRMTEARPAVQAAIAERARKRAPAPELPAPKPETSRPTAKDRQLEALLGTSTAWRRVQVAISSALAAHPNAAAAVARALHGISVKPGVASRLADAIEAAVKEAPPLPRDSDEIPEGTDLDTLDRWILVAERLGNIAEAEGNLQAVANFGRLSASLIEAKRKGTPMPVQDPNEAPDMLEAKQRAREKLHALVDQALRA